MFSGDFVILHSGSRISTSQAMEHPRGAEVCGEVDQAFRSPPRRTRLGGSRPRHSPSTAMSAIARRASRMLPTRTRGRWRGAADRGDVAGASGRMPRASWRCATRAAGRVRSGEGPCSASGPDAWGVGPSRRFLSERTRTLSKSTNSKTARTRMGSMVTVGPLLWPSLLARPSAARDPCGRLPSERGLDPLWRDRQDRATRIPDNTLRSAAKQDVAQIRPAPGPEDNEVAVDLLDELGDAPAMTWKVEHAVCVLPVPCAISSGVRAAPRGRPRSTRASPCRPGRSSSGSSP